MAYDVSQVKNLGKVFVEMGYGVKDGLDVGDVAIGMKLLEAFMSAVNEFQEDADAAFFDALSGASEELALRRRNPAV
jgi:hypothetical protein